MDLSRLVHSTAGRRAGDLALALGCAGAALVVHLNGSEAVPANHAPDAVSAVLTALTGLPLLLRRRYPVAVLVITLAAAFGLVVDRASVGMSILGPEVAFYTAVARFTRVTARQAVGVMAGAIVLTALLRPVDLSAEGAVVNLILVVLAGVLGGGARARRERHAAELDAAEQRAQREHERSATMLVEERLRLTRELHDVIGHALGVMVVQAGVAERLLADDPDRARAAVEQIGATGRTSLAEMRGLLGVLRDGTADALPRDPAPTLADLPALVARVRDAGLPVELVVTGERPGLPALELAAYRVVQEALTNCLRHSGGSRATVRVVRFAASLEVEVVDDGAGADPGAMGSGHGLIGMRERVAVHGGTTSAGPGGHGGFAVRAWFPLENTAARVPAP